MLEPRSCMKVFATPREAPPLSPPGLQWSDTVDGRFMFRGELGGLRRLIMGNDIDQLVTLAGEMAQGRA